MYQRSMYHRLRALLRSGFHYALPRAAFRRNMANHQGDEIELDLLPVIVDQAREAIDVGANMGRYAVRLAERVPHVHAFEAHPRLVRLLKSSLPPRVTVRHAAVSAAAGVTYLNVPVRNGRQVEGLASVEKGDAAADHKRIRVATVTLDELARHDIGFVKIDVEGHELSVLTGAQRLIAAQRPTILVEVEERHRSGAIASVFGFFAERDYRGMFALGSRVLPVEQFVPDMQHPDLLRAEADRRSIMYVNNFLFVPRERWSQDLVSRLEDRLQRLRPETPAN